ncbi:MAG: hypothetical protein AVDCRST_MAG29-1486, partial [uncultured Nocardioidaceae bacterium]
DGDVGSAAVRRGRARRDPVDQRPHHRRLAVHRAPGPGRHRPNPGSAGWRL